MFPVRKYEIYPRVIELLNKDQYMQRSPEWFEKRKEQIMTGSVFASVVGLNPYKTRKELVRNKAGTQIDDFKGNVATRHGIFF